MFCLKRRRLLEVPRLVVYVNSVVHCFWMEHYPLGTIVYDLQRTTRHFRFRRKEYQCEVVTGGIGEDREVTRFELFRGDVVSRRDYDGIEFYLSYSLK